MNPTCARQPWDLQDSDTGDDVIPNFEYSSPCTICCRPLGRLSSQGQLKSELCDMCVEHESSEGEDGAAGTGETWLIGAAAANWFNAEDEEHVVAISTANNAIWAGIAAEQGMSWNAMCDAEKKECKKQREQDYHARVEMERVKKAEAAEAAEEENRTRRAEEVNEACKQKEHKKQEQQQRALELERQALEKKHKERRRKQQEHKQKKGSKKKERQCKTAEAATQEILRTSDMTIQSKIADGAIGLIDGRQDMTNEARLELAQLKLKLMHQTTGLILRPEDGWTDEHWAHIIKNECQDVTQRILSECSAKQAP